MKRRRREPSPPPKASSSVPACDWDATRAAYLERFGPLFASHESIWGGEPLFEVLCFWDPARPGAPAVYVTFGAPEGEVFIEAVAPALGIGVLVEDACRAAPGELPAPVGTKARRTPFCGVILLPEEDGGFRVPAGDGSRPVRRAIAVTRGERARARQGSVAEVLAKIRGAGGDVAHLLRDCTVAPEASAKFRELAGPATVRRLRRFRAESLEELRRERSRGGPCEEIERSLAAWEAGLSYVTAVLPPVSTDADLAAELAAADTGGRYAIVMGAAIERGIDSVIAELCDLPEALHGVEAMLLVAVATHPDALPLIEAATELADECPPPRSLSPDDHRSILVKRLCQVAELLSEGYPEPGVEALLRIGLDAVDAPRDEEDPDYMPVLTAREGWPIGVLAMYQAVLPRRAAQDRALLVAYRFALQGGIELGAAEHTTPLDRLGYGVERFAGHLLMGYSFGVGLEMRAKAS